MKVGVFCLLVILSFLLHSVLGNVVGPFLSGNENAVESLHKLNICNWGFTAVVGVALFGGDIWSMTSRKW